MTHYEPATVKKIPVPVRPPVLFYEPEEPTDDDGDWHFPRHSVTHEDELLCGNTDLNQPGLLTSQSND